MFQVGPVPIGDDFGKDVVTKLTTNVESDGEFYTDASGRDFLKRVGLLSMQSITQISR